MDLQGLKNDPALAPYIRVNVPVPPQMKPAIKSVVAERQHQDVRWGEQNHHPVYWMGILMEELGEAAKEAIELDLQKTDTARHEAVHRLRAELVQLAAVAVAAVEYLDRKEV